jgi:DNA repair exonuclease SbcCD ATPase subunit
MAPQAISIHEALRRLRANPAFDAGSAYVRTKLYCEAITLAGLKIPYWGAIREEIGKGSATDINRGIRDFRTEHAARLAALPTVPPDVPESLAQPLLALWGLALAKATETFEEERRNWLSDVERAEATAASAALAREDIQTALDDAHRDVAQLRDALATSDQQLAKAQALAGDLQQQLAAKDAELRGALDAARTERDAAATERNTILAREDEARRSYLLQIDKARSDGAARVADVERRREQVERQRDQLQERVDALLEDNRTIGAQREALARELTTIKRQHLQDHQPSPSGVRSRLQARKSRRR